MHSKAVPALIITVVIMAIGVGIYAWVTYEPEAKLPNNPKLMTNTYSNLNINIGTCRSYYDGCNTCLRQHNGEVICTELACEDYEEPRCLDHELRNTNVNNDARLKDCYIEYQEAYPGAYEPGETECNITDPDDCPCWDGTNDLCIPQRHCI